MREKLTYLESLRGVAALTVVIFHWNVDSILNNNFTKNGWLMVDFFFVLSGFIIAYNYQSKIISLKSLLIFQIKRFLRLYPIHLIFIIVYLFWLFLQFGYEKYTGNIGVNPAFDENFLKNLIYNIFLLQNILTDKLSFNVPSWSISAEFYTYLVFGTLLLICRNHRKIIIFCSVIISSICFHILLNNSMVPEEFGTIRCLYSFFLGVICFNIKDYFNFNFSKYFGVFIFFLLIFILSFDFYSYETKFSTYIPILFIFLIVFLYNSQKDFFLIKILSQKYLVYLGKISYSIYMCHSIIVEIFFLVITRIFPALMSPENAIQPNSIILSEFLMLSLLIIIIMLSDLLYNRVELKFNSLKSKI